MTEGVVMAEEVGAMMVVILGKVVVTMAVKEA